MSCTASYAADGHPYINPTAQGPGSGKKVGFDATHGETAGQADWVIDGGFSDMACSLAGQGYFVEEMRTYPVTTAALNTYDVVVFPEANIPLTTAEEQAIQDYVAGGKGVLFVADHYQADRNLNTWDAGEVYNGFRRGHYNQTYTSPAYNYNGVTSATTYTFNAGNDWLAQAFGFRFRFNALDLAVTGGNFHPGNTADDPGILPPEKTYGVTSGVYSVATYAGATMSIVDPSKAIGVIYPNQGSIRRWTSAQANDPVAVFTDNVGTPAGGSATYGGINEGAYVVIAKPGAGKVAAAGDSSLWEDGSPKYKREDSGATKSTHDGWSDSDHDTLGLNLINWLATPDAAASIDPALWQPVTPEPYDIYTIAEPITEPWSTPAAGYKWYDACTFKAGSFKGNTTCTTPPPTSSGWNVSYVPANVYPGNKPAAFLDATGLTANTSYTNNVYWYVNQGGTQIGHRYNRSTGTYDSVAYNFIPLTSDSQGNIQRWEFWNLDTGTATRNVNMRLRVGTSSSYTTPYTSPVIPQNVGGTYGYLKVEQSLGYSDGLHAALFTKDGNLDTTAQIVAGADTTITLPPGTYTLDIRNDTTAKVTGLSVAITAGQTVSLTQLLAPPSTWAFENVPANIYPGNSLAVTLHGTGLTANPAYSNQAYVYLTGGAQVSARYNRTTGQFVDGLTAQSLTADATGQLKRIEFWQITPTANTTADYNVRVKVDGTTKDTKTIKQVATGSFGYLTIEQTLGYSDGLHAALFSVGGTLDTAAGISSGADTTVTLPAGTYSVDIRNDAGSKKTATVTITAGQTTSLTGALDASTWSFSSVPANSYPGNTLAVTLTATGLTPAKTYANKAYVYLTGGAQVSARYNRTTGQFVDGLVAQDLTANAQGQIQRIEFWQLTPTADTTSDYNVRVKVGDVNKDTKTIKQVATGSFGYLTIEKALGYSDGLHAALFTKSGTLDAAVGIGNGIDTPVTLPAGTYSLDIRNDAGSKKTATVTITAGQTVSLTRILTPASWTFESVPANVYPGNVLAVYSNHQNLQPGTDYTYQAYVYLTGGTQVSKRYNRTTGQFVDGLTAQTLTASADGAIQRWEFWQIAANANTTADYNVRIKMGSSNLVTKVMKQVATGSFGYLMIEKSLGFSDGLHAALFTKGGTLDTTAGIGSGVDTKVTLPAGTYTLEIRDDAGAALSAATVTIVAGQTTSLLAALDAVPPTITATAAPGPNAEGWNNSDVTVTFTCTDDASGIATCPAPVVLSTEGTNLSASGTAIDKAGNSAKATVEGINLDKTAPVTVASVPAGWTNQAAALTLTASDTLSSVAATHYRLDGGAVQTGSEVTVGDGTHTVKFWSVDKAGNAEAEQSVTVLVDATAPTISAGRAPAANASGWNNGDITVTFRCTDSGSGVATCPDPVVISTEGENQSATGTTTDKAGNSATATVSGINIDKTAPVTTVSAPGGWMNEAVTLTLDASDSLSGVATTYYRLDGGARQTGSTVTLGDGTHTVQFWSVDKAGNAEAAQSVAVQTDLTAPTITAGRAPVANGNGWNNGDVTVTFHCTDIGSGVAVCPDPVVLSAEGADQSATGTATDKAGNAATATVSGINIDKTAPVVTFTGEREYAADETVIITCSAADDLSGVAGAPCDAALVDGTAYSLGLGTHSVTVTVTDKAGNVTKATATYSVKATYVGLSALVMQFVKQPGVEESLLAKLEAAREAAERGNLNARNGVLKAFRNEVAAKADGKALSAKDAKVLDMLATALMQ